MTRLSAILALRDSHALSATERAIESIRDWVDRYGPTMDPEERELTQSILGGLIDIQVNAVQRTVRLGEVMSLRLATEELEQAA